MDTRSSKCCPPFCKHDDCIDVLETHVIDGKEVEIWAGQCKTLKKLEAQS